MDPASVRQHLLDDHQPTLSAVEDCLDAVAESLDLPAGRRAVVNRQKTALQRADLLDSLVGVLESALAVTGTEPEARPVPAPPYVVVTGRGPMLRATVGDERLVVLLRGFELEDGDGYVQADEFQVEVNVRGA